MKEYTVRERTNGVPRSIETFVDLLEWRTEIHPERQAYIFLKNEEQLAISYGELRQKARSLAAWMQQHVHPGERALLLYPPGLDYIIAFFGCLYAGVIAVPAYPPHMVRPEHSMSRLAAIIQDAQPAVALTTAQIYNGLQTFRERSPLFRNMHWLASDTYTPDGLAMWHHPELDRSSLAFLQYTSGSTSLPKGVMVSHGNLLYNEEMIARAMGNIGEESNFVSWLPLYHDMGLIGNVLQVMYLGSTCVLMSPATFVQHPFRWLQAISTFRARVSGGPNFAYELCLRKVTDEQKKQLDLSCWEVAFNGAEPIRASTLEAFTKAFEICGFRKETSFPCYGLAEATLFVTGPSYRDLPIIRTVRASALEQHRVEFVTGGDDDARMLVGCGHTWLEQRVHVVDPQTHRICAPEQVGEIWVSGPNIPPGYWKRSEETERTFGATIAGDEGTRFMRTGDLGFMQDGELFVTGRLKDMIIIEGRNHYPQDIELSVESSHPAVRPGCIAAFSIERDEKERLVVAAEIDPRAWQRIKKSENAPEAMQRFRTELTQTIRQAIQDTHELAVYDVVLLTAGTIPKTSSGKIQRHACRNGYLASTLSIVE
ncbi:acyl-CoA synthetase (AMP-forming)/AMP-acid ligase II [Thermosporothrix hazakensis]|jgi:acyl-CoA synthetase (AMP-forming)/AMP-acid ligase II|uniref:Acyl-CoA synthetase (AMP-forming)/AMP-acid ligase II n=1 Tax=Thermosporothrix hazakensis TaxID=644383 RepID=A0A326U535_THEHA|nr:fatty acyl-AMP ligase [Thermosporothrix hazakensis]PZW28418.1 acyl-CoA synthetase (AMP-forming)/AMP-acid ligase II [Thermosporothrix hazakensis]GCE45198.1 acyl-CoA synthetase [Thermosporothrix hazakensis]